MQRLSRSQIWIETQDIKTKALSDNLRKVREKKDKGGKTRKNTNRLSNLLIKIKGIR